ncbi:hypothetical protein MNB_SV-12-1611 [hydrothermal vent metagenome]|uniref:HNH nuclease domain-containing protein n=1 Tax=hydrothermal vent metagenome TaxID=652676 RepID=A0A1W1BGL1_9ZZZZ
MKSMVGIENEPNFIKARKKFITNFKDECIDEVDCRWSDFKEIFLKFSKYKCPICEDTLNKYDDIDHYRPKSEYEFLRCCCDNYMIMCSDCNRTHKRTSFPLDNDFIASDKNSIKEEKPLLVNPRVDNLLDYFELYFLRSGESLILEVRPHRELDKSSYEYRRAKKSIEIYGLGYCKENKKVDGCRINIFENHYEHLIDLAEAREKSVVYFMKELKIRPKRAEYGFVKFIARGQFKIEK